MHQGHIIQKHLISKQFQELEVDKKPSFLKNWCPPTILKTISLPKHRVLFLLIISRTWQKQYSIGGTKRKQIIKKKKIKRQTLMKRINCMLSDLIASIAKNVEFSLQETHLFVLKKVSLILKQCVLIPKKRNCSDFTRTADIILEHAFLCAHFSFSSQKWEKKTHRNIESFDSEKHINWKKKL